MQIKEIESYISKIPDYPKPGILFYDISTLIFDKTAFSAVTRVIFKNTNAVKTNSCELLISSKDRFIER